MSNTQEDKPVQKTSKTCFSWVALPVVLVVQVRVFQFTKCRHLKLRLLEHPKMNQQSDPGSPHLVRGGKLS